MWIVIAWVCLNVFLCIGGGAYRSIADDQLSFFRAIGEAIWYSVGAPWVALATYLLACFFGERGTFRAGGFSS